MGRVMFLMLLKRGAVIYCGSVVVAVLYSRMDDGALWLVSSRTLNAVW